MKNPTLNRWALELNKYNIVFNDIAGKKNVLADAISRLKQKSLYAEPRDKNNPTAKDRMASRISLRMSTISSPPKISHIRR